MSEPGGTMAAPREIELRREELALAVAWEDGHESVYGFELLRRRCPCAQCGDRRKKAAGGAAAGRGGGGLPMISAGAPRREEVEVVAAQPAGNYALRLRFGDGHDTGIYSFEYLRGLCPCAACRGAEGAR